jgi:hypothetical protein
LTQEKLDSKSKPGNKPNDLSSGKVQEVIGLDVSDAILGFTAKMFSQTKPHYII